jgi:hypothetical protein
VLAGLALLPQEMRGLRGQKRFLVLLLLLAGLVVEFRLVAQERLLAKQLVLLCSFQGAVWATQAALEVKLEVAARRVEVAAH